MLIVASTSLERSSTTRTWTPGGIARLISSSFATVAAATVRLFAPASISAVPTATSRPFSVAAPVRISCPKPTFATSATRIGAPPLAAIRALTSLPTASSPSGLTISTIAVAAPVAASIVGLASLTGADSDDLTAIETGDERAPIGATDALSLEERLAAAERDAARARIDLARAEGVPDPTLGGGVRRFEEGRETAIIARVSIPLPIRNRNTGNIAAARGDTAAAEANLAQVRLDAVRARRDAATRLATAEARLAALGGAGQAQAEEALRIARLGYQAGKFSLVELIDAQTAFNTSRRALIDARLDRARALAALIRATAREGE